MVRAEEDGGTCQFTFPETEGTVDVDVVVDGPTVVSYDVMPEGRQGVCGDGTGPASCLAAVAMGSEMLFAATPVAEHEPIWTGDCSMMAGNDWRARIGSARQGASCRLTLEPSSNVDCGKVTTPRLQISLNGEPLPVSEVFVEVPAPDPARADLSAEVVVEEPASYLWEESVDGSFVELGRSESLTNQLLTCPRDGNYCQLRLTVSDACGRRRGQLLYRLTD